MMKYISVLLATAACAAMIAGEPATAASKNKPKPKELTAKQIEEQRPSAMAWCQKKYGFGRPVRVTYKFGSWYCRYEM